VISSHSIAAMSLEFLLLTIQSQVFLRGLFTCHIVMFHLTQCSYDQSLVTCKKFEGSLYITKVKGKVVPVLNQAPRHEGVLGSGGIAPRILDLGTSWR
jgi:hypothetical protein